MFFHDNIPCELERSIVAHDPRLSIVLSTFERMQTAQDTAVGKQLGSHDAPLLYAPCSAGSRPCSSYEQAWACSKLEARGRSLRLRSDERYRTEGRWASQSGSKDDSFVLGKTGGQGRKRRQGWQEVLGRRVGWDTSINTRPRLAGAWRQS